ncbi:MAG: hypothetical protein ACOYMB_00145 [Patescibacteria group bacterium]
MSENFKSTATEIAENNYETEASQEVQKLINETIALTQSLEGIKEEDVERMTPEKKSLFIDKTQAILSAAAILGVGVAAVKWGSLDAAQDMAHATVNSLMEGAGILTAVVSTIMLKLYNMSKDGLTKSNA